jgi:histidinol-phosphate/aromatic aminotransferase/cobyric acid decarboxylase-like protein
MSESNRYVRIASRTPAENTMIVAILSSILAKK